MKKLFAGALCALFAALVSAQTFPVKNLSVTGTSSFTGTMSGTGVNSLFASPPAIGSSAPSTGAFTTLSATGAVSGSGFSSYLASPPAIGGTAAAAGTFTNLSATGTLNFGTGQITAGYLSPLTGAVNRTLAGKLGDVVSVADFGCDLTGVASSSACFTSALATGKDVYVPPGSYKLTTPITSSTFNQNIYGAGRAASLINCALTSSGNCLTFSGSSGNQAIRNLSLTTSNTNTVKLIDLQSPQVRVIDLYMQNTASAGYAIYAENENAGSNIFVFGLQAIGNNITGAGNASTSFGIRLGLNSQTALLKGNVIANLNTAISIEGANEASIIEENVLENVQYGVNLTPPGSTPPYWAISIRKNYFEQILTACVVFASPGIYNNNVIADNYATSGGGTVYFFSAPTTTGAASGSNRVENNYIQGFTDAFNLVDANSTNFTSTNGNTLDSSGYSTGTNSVNAYTVRTINPYFQNVLVSGAFASKATNRMEMSAGDYQVPVRWEPREYAEKIQFTYTAVGTTSMTATLYKVLGDTQTSIGSTSGTTSGTYSISIGGYAQESYNYFLEVVMTLNGGTTAYVYPLQLYLRK